MVVAAGTSEAPGLRCAITGLSTASSTQSLDEAGARRLRLEQQVRRWAQDGVDIVQLREKSISAGELFDLARLAAEVIRSVSGCRTRLLVNSRSDIAAGAGAHGVHLTGVSGELRPDQVRSVFRSAGLRECFVGVSCHSPDEAQSARGNGADLILFGPVFEKRVAGEIVTPGTGLDRLAEACIAAAGIPVLALGGVTPENAGLCLQAGAAGIAGIRLFR